MNCSTGTPPTELQKAIAAFVGTNKRSDPPTVSQPLPYGSKDRFGALEIHWFRPVDRGAYDHVRA